MVDPTAAGLAISRSNTTCHVRRIWTATSIPVQAPSCFCLYPLGLKKSLPWLFQDDVEDASLEDVNTQSPSQNYEQGHDCLPRNPYLEMITDGTERAFNTQQGLTSTVDQPKSNILLHRLERGDDE